MKISRRSFVRTSAVAGAGLLMSQSTPQKLFGSIVKSSGLITVSTWENTLKSTWRTFELLQSGKNSLDAIEAGIMVESDKVLTDDAVDKMTLRELTREIKDGTSVFARISPMGKLKIIKQ